MPLRVETLNLTNPHLFTLHFVAEYVAWLQPQFVPNIFRDRDLAFGSQTCVCQCSLLPYRSITPALPSAPAHPIPRPLITFPPRGVAYSRMLIA